MCGISFSLALKLNYRNSMKLSLAIKNEALEK